MADTAYKNLDRCRAFNTLKGLPHPSLKQLLTKERIRSCSIEAGGGLRYNYAALPVDENIISALDELSEEQQLIAKYEELLQGRRMNTGEDRMVLHHLTRGDFGRKVECDGKDQGEFYRSQFNKIAAFSEKLQKGEITGSTGQRFTDVVQIGIGGSDLGPRALYLSLEGCCEHHMQAHFISNVDPDDAASVLRDIPLETTLFILVSKSGTTQETLTNHQVVCRYIAENASGIDPARHMVAVTSETSRTSSYRAKR